MTVIQVERASRGEMPYIILIERNEYSSYLIGLFLRFEIFLIKSFFFSFDSKEKKKTDSTMVADVDDASAGSDGAQFCNFYFKEPNLNKLRSDVRRIEIPKS